MTALCMRGLQVKHVENLWNTGIDLNLFFCVLSVYLCKLCRYPLQEKQSVEKQKSAGNFLIFSSQIFPLILKYNIIQSIIQNKEEKAEVHIGTYFTVFFVHNARALLCCF